MADPTKENEQELRLAVAMRGGASMAVWIGGATAELNCLREVLSDEPDHPWSALARLAGYDSVTVDVLAGTSAGGLNATLLSAAVVYGMPFDDMRSVWVRLADVEAMARELPKFWEPDPPSLLDGDGYFRSELARILKQHVRSADESRTRGNHAELLLTATLLDPLVEDHVDGRGGGIEQQRRDASFRFRHRGRPGQPLSDFGTGKEFDDTVLRLAQAARTTSSFPFAFEPAQVHSTVDRPSGGEPDMFGLFSETATPHALPFRVIDGGVLDNIPVTAAIEAIAQAPAARPTNRWLLYLNPDPELFREDRPPHRQFALPVVSEAMQAKLAEESLLTDIEALDEHNRGVARRALLRRSLFAEVAAHSPQRWETVLGQRAAALESEHAAVRAELDAQAVHRLLTEHTGVEDGTLLPPVVGDPLEGWSPIARAELGRRLSQRMGKQADADEVFADVRSLLAGVWQCLTWVWDIERWADQVCVAEIGECKAALYRLRAFGLVLEGHADRYWFHAAKREPIVDIGDLDGWVARVLERRCRLQHRLPSSIEPLAGAVVEAVESDRRFQPALAEFAAEIQSLVESTTAGASAGNKDDDAGSVDAVAYARQALTRIADRLAAVAPARSELGAPEILAHAVLERSGDRSMVLRHLVVLTAALDAGRMPATRINLLRVSADQQTPLPFDSLRRKPQGPLWTEDKVRGGDLANFSAFLSAQWRANDWMWGRIDTATSIIALLLDPARLVRQNADLGADGLLAALSAIVSTPSASELGELDAERAAAWGGFLEQVWSHYHDGVRAELVELFARPDGEHPLERTKKALCERLHWTISATEVAYTAQLSPDVASMESASSGVPDPQRLSEAVRDYDVGRQRLPDLGERRLATVATRFGLLAYRAARPSSSGFLSRLGRWVLTLCKPLLMMVLLAVAAPKRVAAIGFFAVSTIMLADVSGGNAAVLPGVDVGQADSGRGGWPVLYEVSEGTLGVGTFVAGTLGFAFGTWLSHQLIGRGSGAARWIPALVLAVGLTAAASWLFWSGFRLGPLAVAGVAAALTWFATVAYRPSGRIMAALISAVLFSPLLWPVTSYGDMWLLTTILLTAYVQMILVSTVDVLRPRPGR